MKKPNSARRPASSVASSKSTSSAPAEAGFAFSRGFFEDLVDSAMANAKKLGATDCAAHASEGCGLSVSVRKGELENVERNRDKSLGITVHIGPESHRANRAGGV
jgi:PmbA protein